MAVDSLDITAWVLQILRTDEQFSFGGCVFLVGM